MTNYLIENNLTGPDPNGQFAIYLDPDNLKDVNAEFGTQRTLEGSYGHEQLHVQNFMNLIDSYEKQAAKLVDQDVCTKGLDACKERGAAILRGVNNGVNKLSQIEAEHGSKKPKAGKDYPEIGTMPKNPSPDPL